MNAEVIEKFIKKGFLPSPDLAEYPEDTIANIPEKDEQMPIVINKDVFDAINNGFDFKVNINWHEFDRSKALLEKGKDGKTYDVFLNILNYDTSNKDKINQILE